MSDVKMLIAAVTALAGVIVFLFKLYVNQNKDMRTQTAEVTKERADHSAAIIRRDNDAALERQRLASEAEIREAEMRADYEKRQREVIERYDQIARADSKRMLDHEDQVRKEFAEIMERVAAENGKANDALVQLMQRFYDRLVGPRTPY